MDISLIISILRNVFWRYLYIIVGKKLYVGGIPYTSTEDDLREHFSSAGSVESAAIITDKFSGRSRGFGFVEMSSDDEAKKAVETLNGTEFGGRTLVVNEARPREERE